MKLFIWDDYNWMLIGPTDDYDKSEYFIVRKLFVQWPRNPNVEEAYNNVIRQHFEVYGSIESVETVNATSSSASGAKADAAHIHEAYVTFRQSEDAFNAFMANRNDSRYLRIYDSKAIKVLPADTWHQPDGKNGSPKDVAVHCDTTHRCNDRTRAEHECTIFNLSQLSLDEKNYFCDCVQSEMTIDFYELKLKRVNEVLPSFKGRVKKLHLKLPEIESDDADDNHLSYEEFMKRVAQVLEATLGQNFEGLILSAPQIDLSVEILKDFAPLLQQLKSLSLTVNSVDLYQLRDYCPNLVDLEVSATSSFDGNLLGATIQNWSTIVHLNIFGQTNIASDSESGIKFRQFIELNSQIETLILHCIVDNDLMKTIASSLPHLKAFELIRSSYDDIDLVLGLLTGLKELESIKMNTLKVKKDELKAMEKCARKLVEIKQMRLVIMFQNYEPDTSEPEDYPRLLTFQLKDHDGCDRHKSKQVIGFDEDIDDVVLPNDGQVFVGIVNTKNPEKSADRSLMDTIFGALHATHIYYPELVNQIILDAGDCSQWIYISHA